MPPDQALAQNAQRQQSGAASAEEGRARYAQDQQAANDSVLRDVQGRGGGDVVQKKTSGTASASEGNAARGPMNSDMSPHKQGPVSGDVSPATAAEFGNDVATHASEPVQKKRAAVQAKSVAGGGEEKDKAAAGVRGKAEKLPYKDQIQKSFGKHKLGDVKVYTDKGAQDAAKEIGAKAYAMGDKIAFGSGADLHTAAHEAAHVIQQRAGITGGGKWETHADKVADAVVAGEDAEPLLDEVNGGANPDKYFGQGDGAVQKKASAIASEHLGSGYFKGENAKGSLGASMESAAQEEDVGDQAAFPTVEEKMGPGSEETPPDESVDAPADPGAPADGVEGADPGEPDLPETQNLDAPAQPNAPNIDTGEGADIEAMKRDFGSSLRSMPTAIDGLQTDPGPSPEVQLAGASDPERSERQEADSFGKSDTALTEATAAVDNGPGPEQVQPRAVAETHSVEIPDVPVLDGMDDIEKAVEFNGMSKVTAEIKNKTDEVGAAQLESTVAEAQSELDKASSDRMAERDREIAKTETENKRLIDEANREQDAEVARARADIDGKRSDTKREQQAGVDSLKQQSEREKAKVKSDIDSEVNKRNKEVDDKFKATEREASAKQREAEAEAARQKAEAEREAENDSWWSRAASAIGDAFDALADAITGLLDGLMEAVNALVDAAKDFANSVIDACVSFVSAALEAYGDLLKGLVDGLLGDLFPGLAAALTEFIDAAVNLALSAVNFIADKLKEGINALLDAVAGALNAIISAYKAAIQAALALAKAVLTGDWEALGRMILEGVLQLAGIPPADFYALIDSAMGAIDTIIEDPGAFVGNVIDAAAGGMSQFGDNILDHLQAGFFEWIVGPIGDMGITLPSTWDLAGIFGLAAQVLGLTQEGIRGVIEEELGEGAGVIFDYVWRYVGALITGGIEGLWEEIQNDLSSLYDMVIDGIKDWLIETIVTQAIMRLATMFNPVGALLNAIITVWNVYKFLRDEIQRIWGIVSTVVETIAQIAAGNTQPSKDGIENALASLIPVAISFLANLLGIDGITERVREIIEGIQDTVHGAIRSLIQRVKGMFQGGEDRTEEDNPTFGEASFSAPTGDGGSEEGHRVYVETSADAPRVLVASDPAPPEVAVATGGEFEALDGDQESNVVTLGRQANDLAEQAWRDGDQAKADQASAILEQIKAIMVTYSGERTLEAMCPVVGGSAQTKYTQLIEGKGDNGRVSSAVDTFIENCDAALEADHGLTPLQAIKNEASANSGNYILLGNDIDASEYEREGGVSRLMDLPSVWNHYIGSQKDRFADADHMIHEIAEGNFDVVAALTGNVQGAAAEGWWFRHDQADGTDLGELKEQLSVNDPAYNKGVIRVDFSAADMGHAAMDLKKPTILDAVAQGDERDPMWTSNPGRVWGKTGGGCIEGVAPPVDVTKATDKTLILNTVPEPEIEPIVEAGDMEGEGHTLTVDAEEGTFDMASTIGPIDDKIATMQANIRTAQANLPADKASAIQTKGDALASKVQEVHDLMVDSTKTTVEKEPQLRLLTERVLALLRELGDVGKIKDLIEPFPYYKAPKLGSHTVPEDSDYGNDEKPDGITRESHHVPAKQLAKSLADAVKETGNALVTGDQTANADVWIVGAVLAGNAESTGVTEGGDGMASILLHRDTHRTGVTAVHRSRMRDHVDGVLEGWRAPGATERERIMQGVPAKLQDAAQNQDMTNITSEARNMNPTGRHWEAFLARVRTAAQAIETAEQAEARGIQDPDQQAHELHEVEEESDAVEEALNEVESDLRESSETDEREIPDKLLREIKNVIEIAYNSAVEQGTAAVVAALSASMVDGPQGDHPSAAEMATQANSDPIWTKVRAMAD